MRVLQFLPFLRLPIAILSYIASHNTYKKQRQPKIEFKLVYLEYKMSAYSILRRQVTGMCDRMCCVTGM